jgi:hypothetical protein
MRWSCGRVVVCGGNVVDISLIFFVRKRLGLRHGLRRLSSFVELVGNGNGKSEMRD